VISTGMMVPTLSWVAALYSLQKAMMFTPCRAHTHAAQPGRAGQRPAAFCAPQRGPHLCAQSGADRRRRVGLAGRERQLYQPGDCPGT